MRIMSLLKSPGGLLINYHQEPLGPEILHVAACVQEYGRRPILMCWHSVERLGAADPTLRQQMQQDKLKAIVANGPHHSQNRWPTALIWQYPDGHSRAIFFRAGSDSKLILANVCFGWPDPNLGRLVRQEWELYCGWVKDHAPRSSRVETEKRVEKFLAEVDALIVKKATLEEYYRHLVGVILQDLQGVLGLSRIRFGTTLNLVQEPAWQEATRQILNHFVNSTEVREKYNELAAATPFGIASLGEKQLPAYVLRCENGIWRRIPAEANDLNDPTAIFSAKSLLFQLLARLVKFESTVVCGISPYASSVSGLAQILNRRINQLVSVRFRDREREPSLADWFWGRTEEVLDAAYIELIP